MKTKITFFVALCLLMMISMSVKAQSIEEYGTPLITDASQFYDNQYGDASEGTVIANLIDGDASTFWHTDWHGASHPDTEHHWLPVKFDTPVSGNLVVWMIRRSTTNDHPTKMLVKGSNDGVNWTDITEVSLPYTGSGTTTQSDAFTLTTPYTYLEFGASDCTGSDYGYRTFWHCAEFQLYQIIDHSMELQAKLTAVLNQYDSYLYGEEGGGTSFHIGTELGEYSDAAANQAFLAALQRVYNILDGSEDMPDEDGVLALVNEVNEQYNKVLASEVLFKLAHDGYYRIVSNLPYYTETETGEYDMDGNPVTNRTYVTKAMYSSLEGWGCWGTYDTTDCRQVWKLEQKEDGIRMVNAATDMQFAGAKDGAQFMSTAVDTLMGFDWCGDENGHHIIYIRYATSGRDLAGNGGPYLHQWYHGKGTGTDHSLCLWKATFNMGDPYDSDKGTSEWYLEEVSDEEAAALIEAYLPYKDHDQLVIDNALYQDKADELIKDAKDYTYMNPADTTNPLITDASQFSSNAADQAEGQDFSLLIDGNTSTFWHSDWHGVVSETHWLQVELKEALQGPMVVRMIRRAIDWGHTIQSTLECSNDGENWQVEAVLDLPYTGQLTTVQSDPFTLSQPYKYLRFYNTKTSNDCVYMNPVEFQLYPTTNMGTGQFYSMGDVAQNLVDVLAQNRAIADADLTVTDYDKLKAAYEAMQALYVDPTDLRSVLSSNDKATKYLAVGEDPGFWSDNSTAQALDEVLASAQAYDYAGKYTTQQNQDYIDRIQQAVATYKAAINKVRTDKWYKLYYDTEEHLTSVGITPGNTKICGQTIAAGRRITEMDENGESHDVAHSYASEDIHEGCELFWTIPEDIDNQDAALFRFIQLTDSTYAIQNKASGLFINRETEAGGVSLKLTPDQFQVVPCQAGLNLLVMSRLDGTTFDKCNINVWANDYGSLVAWWNDTTPGCNSSMRIEAVEDVDLSDYAPSVTKTIHQGDIQAHCYPVSVAIDGADVMTVDGCYVDEENDSYIAVTLSETGEIPAGTPFIFMGMGEYDQNSEESITYTIKDDVVFEPKEENGLCGVFYLSYPESGTIYFAQGKTHVNDGSTSVGTNGAFFKWGVKKVDDMELGIQVTGNYTDYDAVQNTLAKVAKSGTIYNMAGQVVRTNATLRDMKGLGTGIYILNGTKVMVK